MDDSVVSLFPKKAEEQSSASTRVRALGVFGQGCRTGNLEEHLLTDSKGNQYMPITFITVNDGQAVLLMNCADKPPAALNDNGDR